MTSFEKWLSEQDTTLSQWIDNELWKAYENRTRYGDLRGLQATADDTLKTEDAILRENVPKDLKTVADVDAWVRQQPGHKSAVEKKKDKYAAWATAEMAMKVLYAMKDKYQTDAKAAREMERAHR